MSDHRRHHDRYGPVFLRRVARAGLALVAEHHFLPYQYFVVLQLS